MAFDFPSSPTIGTVSNGFVYNGMGWSGGPVPAAGQPTEQFFDVGGLTSIDIDVPTWAKMATIEGVLWPSSGTAYCGLQVSMDGTTFYAGTSYQLIGGISHNVTGGYTTQTAGAAPILYVTYPKTNLNIPQICTANMNLEVVSGNQLIALRSEMQGYDNSTGASQYIWQGYLNVVVVPARVKKLRFLIQPTGQPAWPAASFLKIKWGGTSATIPQSNAIPDSPQDGGEYVRVNGVWRLKSQSFAPTGTQNINVPLNARFMKLRGAFYHSATSTNQMRLSIDGTTFAAGATDYTYSGNYFYSGSAAITKQPPLTASALTLSQTTDTISIPITIDLTLSLTKSTVQTFGGMLRSMGYHSSVTAYHTELSFAFYTSSSWATAATALKAVQLFPSAGTWLAQTVIDVEWVY
jgi:hypothetical protein